MYKRQFKDFGENDLFPFIDKMRENGIVIEHKAAITPTNIKWTLRYLLEENDQEHKTCLLYTSISFCVKIIAFNIKISYFSFHKSP